MSYEKHKANAIKEIDSLRHWINRLEGRLNSEELVDFGTLQDVSDAVRNIVYECGMLNGRFMERIDRKP